MNETGYAFGWANEAVGGSDCVMMLISKAQKALDDAISESASRVSLEIH